MIRRKEEEETHCVEWLYGRSSLVSEGALVGVGGSMGKLIPGCKGRVGMGEWASLAYV